MRGLPIVVTFALLTASGPASGERFLTVRGEAEVKVPPDFVRVEVMLEAQERNVEAAKRDVDERAREVVEAIEAVGIEKEDLVISGVEVEPQYRYDKNDNETLIGYRVGRGFEIRLRDLSQYEILLALLVDAGISAVQDVTSGVDDRYSLERAALEEAARNARRKADAMATGLGIKLGLPLEVGEDRLLPQTAIRQRMAAGDQIQEIVVTGMRKGVVDPLLFVPDDIRVRGVVAVRFEILAD